VDRHDLLVAAREIEQAAIYRRARAVRVDDPELILQTLRQRLQPVASFAAPLRLLWLVDNPRIPYPPESLDDGELQFDICSQSFEAFLDANSLRAEFLEVSPEGLGIQCVNLCAAAALLSSLSSQ
jgi:hypothetical protein